MSRRRVSMQEKLKWMPKVAAVLKKAARRAAEKNIFLSAYQILQQLPDRDRRQLLKQYGQGGKTSGNDPAATEVVMAAALLVPDIEVMYMDSQDVRFLVENQGKQDVLEPAGRKWFGIYRVPNGSPKSRRCKLPFMVKSTTLKRTLSPGATANAAGS